MEEVGIKVSLAPKVVSQILAEAVEASDKNLFDCQYAEDITKCSYGMGCTTCIAIRKGAQVGANLERQISGLAEKTKNSARAEKSVPTEPAVDLSNTSVLTYGHLCRFIVDVVKSNFKCWDGDITAGAEWMCDNLMNLAKAVLGDSEYCLTHTQVNLILNYLKGYKNYNKADEEITAFEEGARIVARLVHDFIRLILEFR